jgi:uncharacterized protein (TIGR03437 family)
MRSCRLSPLLFITICAQFAAGQSQTVGLFLNNSAKTSPGYVLLPPMHNGHTYLIDNNGQVVNTWYADSSEPGRMAYLLPNGHLLRSVSLPNSGPNTGGGDGGRITEYDWAGNLLWQFDYSTPLYAMHHDLKYLPNGNVIVLLVETKTLAEMAAAGFRPNILQTGSTVLVPDAIIEVQPIRPTGGQIVWEWHVWDHLVQNYDSTKANYGVPAQHPELVDPNASPNQIASFWNHMNAIDYNADLDQIMVSVRGNSELWIIDHSTTKAEAASHLGGKYGKGGDLLYRWGNPVMYGAGKTADEMLYQQHDAQWIAKGRPGAGNILVFNNGVSRPAGNYSSIDELVSPVDSKGSYPLTTGSAYAPNKLTWTYFGSGDERYYDADVSGAERQPNGNTLICYGTHGVLEEVTSAGELVWKYVNPVSQTGPLLQGQTPGLDQKNQSLAAVFKVRRYAPDYAGLVGHDLTPKGPVELYPLSLVNGAGLQVGAGAAGGILTAFGTALADSIGAASSTSLPITLGGATVQITDSAGATQTCPLFYASPTQINLLLPTGVAAGPATITIKKNSGGSLWTNTSVEPVAPGIFSMNASGKGVGAIVGIRVAGGQSSDVPIFSYNSTTKQYVSVPVDIGASTDQVYLSLYGTGLRGFSSLSAFTVTIGGVSVPVSGAAAQSQYPGLDQVNIGPLPRTLAGKGESNVVLQVDGRTANTVTVNIK